VKQCSHISSLTAGGYTLAGYLSECSLQKADMDVIKECICARLVQSLIMGTYSSVMHPENSQYFLLTYITHSNGNFKNIE
jgi:hydroxylysine kinase